VIERIPEFASNHPLLMVALAVTLALIGFTEVQRLRRVAKPLSPARATRLANSEDAVFVDARRRKDFDAGHVPGARSVPASEAENHVKQLEKLRTRPVILYDEGGLEAERAAKTLARHGFTELYALDGGLPAWRKADLPLETQSAQKGKKKG
jgi:rhodanese-related sulfurtransferase